MNNQIIPLSKTPEYSAWAHAKSRCTNPNVHNYHRYGGRGIAMCDKWSNSFTRFLEDMGAKPTSKHTLDRRNNDLGYHPENCHWATPKHQANNRKSNRLITYQGETKTLMQWSEHLGIEYHKTKSRLKSGLPFIDAIKDVNLVSRMITINDKTLSLSEWCIEYNQPYKLVHNRIHKLGWEPKKALTRPMQQRYSHENKRAR